MFAIANADESALQFLDKIYCFDSYHIVNPFTYEVFEYRNGTLIKQVPCCYMLWEHSAPCHNCSSRRSLLSKGQLMKLEYLHNKLILIISTPILLCGNEYILELAKDVTDSLIVNDIFHTHYQHIPAMISELNDASIRDSFTGLYNKRYIEQELDRLVNQAIHSHGILTAAIADIDYFKRVNDTYGHILGDTVLLTITSYLEHLVPEEDAWVGRLGGDEFLLVFPGYPHIYVEQLCQSIAQQVKAHMYKKNDQVFSVSLSIGVKQFSLEEDLDSITFLDHVDQEMYREKRKNKLKQR